MIAGKLALGGLSLEFGGAQKRFDELSAKVEALGKRHEELLEEEAAAIQGLARIYLPELTTEAVSAGLRELQAHLQDALVEQRQHRVTIARHLEEAGRRAAELQSDVEELARVEEKAAARLADAGVAVEAMLADDSEHGNLADKHEAVMERRSALKHRRTRLQGTANVERHNYEAFKPFAYLQKRQFGEPEYHAGPITRALDRWLARRIDYDLLAERYRILRMGPHAIQAEIRRLTGRAEELEAEVDRRQDEAGERHGLIPALQADAETQRAVVEGRQRLHEAAERRGPLWQRSYVLSRPIGVVRMSRRSACTRTSSKVSRYRSWRHWHARHRIRGTTLWSTTCTTSESGCRVRVGTSVFIERNWSTWPGGPARWLTSRAKPLGVSRLGEATFRRRRGWKTCSSGSNWTRRHRPNSSWTSSSDNTFPAKSLFRPTRGAWLDGLASSHLCLTPELGAVTVEFDEAIDGEHEITVHDSNGRVISRRVTRRSTDDSKGRP